MGKSKRVIVCSNGCTYNTVKEAARAMGGPSSSILRVLNGNQPSAYGWRWKYEYRK